MTTPDERYLALVRVPEALLALVMQRGPVRKTELRQIVYALLHHYPSDADLERMRTKCKGILQ